MAKTEITLLIEEALKTYKRGDGYSYIWHLPEVQTTGSFNSSFKSKYYHISNPFKFKINGQIDVVRISYKYEIDWNKVTAGDKSNSYSHNLEITCFEIKISLSDFKSKSGHNFIGDYNYYVVPRDLYLKIKELIPDGIGCITYSDGKLREVKKSSRNDNWYLERNRFLWNCITRQSIETNKLENRIKFLEFNIKEDH